jgi:hypothetical protein
MFLGNLRLMNKREVRTYTHALTLMTVKFLCEIRVSTSNSWDMSTLIVCTVGRQGPEGICEGEKASNLDTNWAAVYNTHVFEYSYK